MQRECEKGMLIKVIEPIVYLVIIINLVIAISYKRKSKKTPVKVVAPIVILGIGLFVCDTVYTHRSFSSVEKAVEAYGDNAEIIRILQGENSTYVIMDNEGTVEGKIFPESFRLSKCVFRYRQRVSRCKDKYRYVNDRNQWGMVCTGSTE